MIERDTKQIHLCLYYHTVYTISDHWIMLSGPILHYCFRQTRKTKCDRCTLRTYCTLRTCCPVRSTYKTTRQETIWAQNDPSRNYPTSKRPNLKTNQGTKRTKRKMNHHETTQAKKRTKFDTTQGTKRPKA
jgi:hypothetical protein